jgi:hypothetical protein
MGDAIVEPLSATARRARTAKVTRMTTSGGATDETTLSCRRALYRLARDDLAQSIDVACFAYLTGPGAPTPPGTAASTCGLDLQPRIIFQDRITAEMPPRSYIVGDDGLCRFAARVVLRYVRLDRSEQKYHMQIVGRGMVSRRFVCHDTTCKEIKLLETFGSNSLRTMMRFRYITRH